MLLLRVRRPGVRSVTGVCCQSTTEASAIMKRCRNRRLWLRVRLLCCSGVATLKGSRPDEAASCPLFITLMKSGHDAPLFTLLFCSLLPRFSACVQYEQRLECFQFHSAGTQVQRASADINFIPLSVFFKSVLLSSVLLLSCCFTSNQHDKLFLSQTLLCVTSLRHRRRCRDEL